MNKDQFELPSLMVGLIFIAAGVYAFAADEVMLLAEFSGASSSGHRISGLTQLIIAFLLLSGGSLLIWTKGKW